MKTNKLQILFCIVLVGFSYVHSFAAGSYEYSDDSIRKREEQDKIRLKAKIGLRYWVKKNETISFYNAPDILARSFHVTDTESFVVKALVPDKYGNASPYSSYYRIVFDSGKVAYLSSYFLEETSGYYSKQYFLNEDPRLEAEKRRAEATIEAEKRKAEAEEWYREYERKKQAEAERKKEKKEKIERALRDLGLSKGRTLWVKHRVNKLMSDGLTADLPGLTKVMINDRTILEDDQGPTSLLITFLVDDKEVSMFFRCHTEILIEEDVKSTFYMEDPSKKVAKWGKRVLQAIKNGRIFIGMTEDQAKTSWGVPQTVNRSGGKWGVHEQWIYGDYGPYLYFENKKLTAWQN